MRLIGEMLTHNVGEEFDTETSFFANKEEEYRLKKLAKESSQLKNNRQ
jgi:hypothetical protein